MEQEEQQMPEKKKRKSAFKKTADWAGLLRNFATIIASFISVITLFILIRQNERIYQPDLAWSPEPKLFQVVYRDTRSECDDLRIISSTDSTSGRLALRCMNLGLGAAKDLRIAWSFDPDKLDDTVRINNHTFATGVTYESKVSGLLFENCVTTESLDDGADYCLPFHTEKEPTRIALPLNYIRLWTNLAIQIGTNSTLPGKQRMKIIETLAHDYQDLSCTIRYQDINGQQYRQAHQVQLIPHFLDIRAKTLILGVSLRDKETGQAVPRRYRFSMYEADASFFETDIEL
ncbi:MAG: hypothetical protein IPM98_18975 [Lewinellaceae bacterium]|nr:hypothetical protein [Lewinellaceae bacterium]